MDGSWSSWSRWGDCSQTCGGGWRGRKRECTPPLNGGSHCTGDAFEIADCRNSVCNGRDHIMTSLVVAIAETINDLFGLSFKVRKFLKVLVVCVVGRLSPCPQYL